VTAMIVPGLDDAPTSHSRLRDWVRETAELTMPDRIEWCDGSQQEWERLTAALVEVGTFAPGSSSKSRRDDHFLACSLVRRPGV
jgi:phosphoenolpyruvate carboxykinase (GTP)